MGAVHPPTSIVHYHSAKAGVLALAYNLALELARLNIYVNAILPGPIRTPFWKPVTKGVQNKDAYFIVEELTGEKQKTNYWICGVVTPI